MNVEYVTDAAGHPISVIVPIDLWRKMQTNIPIEASTVYAHEQRQTAFWQLMGIFKDDDQFVMALEELNHEWQHWSQTLSV